MRSICHFTYLINVFPLEYFICTRSYYNNDCFIVSLQFFKFCQLLFAQVSCNYIGRKYACKRIFLQIIKWLDKAYRVVRETRRQKNKCISRYNVVLLVSCYSVNVQKQPSIGVIQKMCFAKTQQIYRRSPVQKCEFNKVA